jgi:nucleotide-binding universal stress UspA family protein
MAPRIVVGYDGSNCAKVALDRAISLATPDGTVFITYAFAPPSIGSSSLVPPNNLRKMGEKLANEALQVARQHGVTAEVVLVNQRSAEGLMKVAEEKRADMIVVGTHGESPIKGVLLGSTPYQLVHRTTTPLLIVPEVTQKAA